MKRVNDEWRRWLGLVAGAGALGVSIAAISHQAVAQGTQPPRPEDGRPGTRQPGTPPREGEVPGGFGGRFGGGGFRGPGMGPGMPMMGMMGGGATMTANENTVFVLRGNQLLAFNASSLKLRAQVELPMPHPASGAGPDSRGGARPERDPQ